MRHWTKIRQMSLLRQAVWLLGAGLLVGAAIECGQSFIERSVSLRDLLRDLEGVALALVFLSPGRKGLPAVKRFGLQVVLAGLVIFECCPLAMAVTDEIIAKRQFPLLADFETPVEVSRTDSQQVSRTDLVARHGRYAAKIKLTTEQYSGAGLKYFPGDWSSYQHLNFSLYNEGTSSLRLICRINDRRHVEAEQHYEDRFNRPIDLVKGWNDIQIALDEVADAPQDRRMDMQQIQGFYVFAVQLPQPREVYLDYVYLD